MATRSSSRGAPYSYGAQPAMRDPAHQLPARVSSRLTLGAALPAAAAALGLAAAGAAAAYLLRRRQQQEESRFRHRILNTLTRGVGNAGHLAGQASSKAADLAAHEGRDLALGVASAGQRLAKQGSKLAAKTAGSVRDFAEHEGSKALKTGQTLAAEGGKVAEKGYHIGRQAAQDSVRAARKKSKAVAPLALGLALAAAAVYVEKLASKESVFGSNGDQSPKSEPTPESAPKRRTASKKKTTTARKRSTSKSE